MLTMRLQVFHVALHPNQQQKFLIRENLEHFSDYII